MKADQVTEKEIERLVDEFYKRIRMNPELAPIFNRAIPSDWGPHLETMRKFWSSVMLTSGRYKGNPVAKHVTLEEVERHLFDVWLTLFRNTCQELFEDSVARVFVAKAERIAESLKIALFYRPDGPGRESDHEFRSTTVGKANT